MLCLLLTGDSVGFLGPLIALTIADCVSQLLRQRFVYGKLTDSVSVTKQSKEMGWRETLGCVRVTSTMSSGVGKALQSRLVWELTLQSWLSLS